MIPTVSFSVKSAPYVLVTFQRFSTPILAWIQKLPRVLQASRALPCSQ